MSIKFWSRDEIVYVVNRGWEPVDLADDWWLYDKGDRHELEFAAEAPAGRWLLPPGGVLRVHSGRPLDRQPILEGELQMLHWTGEKVWNNDGDEARLEHPAGNVVYRYTYKGRGG